MPSPWGFDRRNKYLELKELRDRIRRSLGHSEDSAGSCEETVDQVHGGDPDAGASAKQPDFQRYSQRLALRLGQRSPARGIATKTLKELGARLCRHLLPARRPPSGAPLTPRSSKEKPRSPNCRASCRATSGDGTVQVKLQRWNRLRCRGRGGITSSSTPTPRFSELDLQVLEVHEGWVHVGTTLNGPPSSLTPPGSSAGWHRGSPRVQEGWLYSQTLTFQLLPGRGRSVSRIG